MTPQSRLLTAEDFAALPRDGLRLELVRGELVAMAPSFADHGDIVGALHAELGYYIRSHHLGKIYGAETGFLIARNPDTVRAPDLAFIQSARLAPEASAPNWNPIIPDLVAEVVSSRDRATEVEEKVQMWLDAGVRLIWVAYPGRREIVAHRPGQPPRILATGDMLEGLDVVPDFAYPVAGIF